jgi:hypothetical protein
MKKAPAGLLNSHLEKELAGFSVANMIEMLQNRISGTRFYRAPFDFEKHVEAGYDRMVLLFGDKVEGRAPFNCPKGVGVSDFFIQGSGGHSELAMQMSLGLPLDFQAFDARFVKYALAARNLIMIISASEVLELTQGLRQGEGVKENTPHQLYRFAQVAGDSAHFMFRWHEDGSFRDVAFARYADSSEADILGADGQVFFCDKDFSSWLMRMIQTDGALLSHTIGDAADLMVERVG